MGDTAAEGQRREERKQREREEEAKEQQKEREEARRAKTPQPQIEEGAAEEQELRGVKERWIQRVEVRHAHLNSNPGT